MGRILIKFILLAFKDFNTFTHSIRVGFNMFNYAFKINDLENVSLVKAFFMGLFHDLGKLEIPTEILKKKGNLTKTEFCIIKTHVTNETAMLVEEKFPGTMDHHEKMDGQGYFSKNKEELSVYSRLLTIADIEDAMRNKRSYKKKMSKTEVYLFLEDLINENKLDKIIFRKIRKKKRHK